MEELKKSKLFKYIIASCIFIAILIGSHVYASDNDQSLLPMTIDYGIKPYMIYDEYAAKFALDVSMDAYGDVNNKNEWAHTYTQNGFNTDTAPISAFAVIYPVTTTYLDEQGNTQTQVNYVTGGIHAIIGVKTITDTNGDDVHLISIGFRGTQDLFDALTDVNVLPNSQQIHTGFYNIATIFYSMRNGIVLNIDGHQVSLGSVIDDMKNENSQYKMIVTGHSLGGAVADVFVGQILRLEGVMDYNVTAYTFAAPKNVSATYANPTNAKNIINIVNADDWVPTETLSGKARIGQDFIITPNEDFRYKNYDDVYSSGKNSSYYTTLDLLNPINLPSNIHTIEFIHNDTYRALLSDMLNPNIQNYTSLNTVKGLTINNADAHFRSYSAKYINGNITMGSGSNLTFDSGGSVYIAGTVNQNIASRVVIDNDSNIYIEGNYNAEMVTGSTALNLYIDVLSGKLEVNGDMMSIGKVVGVTNYVSWINIQDTVIIHGNFTATKTAMKLPLSTSYLKIYGDCNMSLIVTSSNYRLLDGMVEVLGDYKSDYPTNTTDYYKLKLSGEIKQTITNSKFSKLELSNTSQDGVEFVGTNTVFDLITINGTKVLNGENLSIDGKMIGDLYGNATILNLTIDNQSTKIYGNVYQKGGNLKIENSGELYIEGNYNVEVISSQNLYLDVLSGKLEVNGDMMSIGRVSGIYNYVSWFNIQGEVIVHGNFTATKTAMKLPLSTSYLKIYGDCNMSLMVTSSNYRLLDGMVEVLGDYKSDYPTNTTDYYKLKLSGETKQTITNSKFSKLELSNTSQDGVEFVGTNTVLDLITTNGTKVINGANLNIDGKMTGDVLGDINIINLTLNNQKAHITGTVNQLTAGRLTINNNSELYIDGDYNLKGSTNKTCLDVLNGKLEVGGNMSTQPLNTYYPYLNIQDELIVHGNTTINGAILGLSAPTSYLKTYGDCTMTTITVSAAPYNLTNGTIEVLGNYNTNYAFSSGGTTKLILSGDKKQTVTATSIPIVELANTSADGVEFLTKISITQLFNHNNLHYVLDNGGTFVDYDKDGVKDNLDKYPMDATQW